MVDIVDKKELTGSAANLPAQGLGLIGTHAVPFFPASCSGQQSGIILTTRLREVKGTQHRAPPVPACKVPALQRAEEDDACWGQHDMSLLLASKQPDMNAEVAIHHRLLGTAGIETWRGTSGLRPQACLRSLLLFFFLLRLCCFLSKQGLSQDC